MMSANRKGVRPILSLTRLISEIKHLKYLLCQRDFFPQFSRLLFRSSLGDDDDTIAKELESIKVNGRKCSSVCCTGAFMVTHYQENIWQGILTEGKAQYS